MSIAKVKGKNVDIHLWAPAHEVESSALDQLRNVAALPWVFHHVAAMADVHTGKGATIGSVVAMKGAIAPSAVGVDIGCGITATCTSLAASDLPDNLREIRDSIEAVIPVGFNSHEDPAAEVEGLSLWGKRFKTLPASIQERRGPAKLQLGTLGGGNHFIEICLDKLDRVWIMLHSGSRNVGLRIANLGIADAKKQKHNRGLGDLAVLLDGTPEMASYKNSLAWAQKYASENRRIMLSLIQHTLIGWFDDIRFEPSIECHHNYVSEETHFETKVYVTRKGAIQARAGQMGIIPGSMGTRSYIVEGLGSAEAFESASHGAGRRMSRSKAKKTFTEDDIAKQLDGVECRRDRGILDELPAAYKDIDQVMANQADLVEARETLRQVLCIKG